MAGSQDQDENPVAINVVPMVDVIFCLCVFFMCSFKFHQLEGKFDSWLPRDCGPSGGAGMPTGSAGFIEEVRVALLWDPATDRVVRQFGTRSIGDDAELQSLIRAAKSDWTKVGRPNVPVTIDAAGAVPWRDVVDVMNLCKREQIERIEFAYGTGEPPGPSKY